MISSVSSSSTPALPASAGQTLGKNDFIKLLITQMRNQDPLNPLDQNQFLAQTAQFSSLESLQNIGTQLTDLKTMAQGQSLTQGASLLGKSATAMGRDVQLGLEGAQLPFVVQVPGNLQIRILDAQNTAIRDLSVKTDLPGQYEIAWDGLDSAGQSASPGIYHYQVIPQGGAIAVAAQGTLTGMTPTSGGVVYHIGDAIVRADDLISVG